MREWRKFRMLYLIIGLILVIIIVIFYGTWMRKKTYGAIDRADETRTSLAALPVAGEIAKIKELKMAGDTEKKFEQWRKDWDSIVTAELPSIEEHLFEAEELTDKYRFKKAAGVVTALNRQMDQIKDKTDRILKEINMVVDSERKNRKDVTPIKEAYHQIKKLMITKRSKFRGALPLLEASVREIDDQYAKYGSETGNGNYIEARDILLEVKTKVDKVNGQIEKVPEFYEEILQATPDQLRELSQGKEEMEEQGYSLTHLGIDTLIKETEQQLQVLKDLTDKLELDQVADGLKSIHDQMDWLYSQLDKEVDSRKQVLELIPEIGSKLDETGTRLEAVTRSTEDLRDSYRIREEDLNAQREVGRTYQKLQKSFDETDDQLSGHTEAFSLALDQLNKIKSDIENVSALTLEFDQKLKALRKDEIEAKNTMVHLRHSLFETGQLLRRSNLPGAPQSFSAAMEQASDHIKFVDEKLDAKPLNMEEVREALKAAGTDVEEVARQARTLVDTAGYAEFMIRYGNRYRSSDPQVDLDLSKAEDQFRAYDYASAVKTAIEAVERKEPKILKRTDLFPEHQA